MIPITITTTITIVVIIITMIYDISLRHTHGSCYHSEAYYHPKTW